MTVHVREGHANARGRQGHFAAVRGRQALCLRGGTRPRDAPIAAVLSDFSGTLFRIESTDAWLRAALDGAGLALPAPELARTARALQSAGALPGGAQPLRVPAELAEV